MKLIRLKKNGKSRGFGFVQFETEDDLKDAYRRADGKKIDGKRCVPECSGVIDVDESRGCCGCACVCAALWWMLSEPGLSLAGCRVDWAAALATHAKAERMST